MIKWLIDTLTPVLLDIIVLLILSILNILDNGFIIIELIIHVLFLFINQIRLFHFHCLHSISFILDVWLVGYFLRMLVVAHLFTYWIFFFGFVDLLVWFHVLLVGLRLKSLTMQIRHVIHLHLTKLLLIHGSSGNPRHHRHSRWHHLRPLPLRLIISSVSEDLSELLHVASRVSWVHCWVLIWLNVVWHILIQLDLICKSRIREHSLI